MDWIEIAGLVGAALSSLTFVPQVFKAWQTKRINDLSIYMILIVLASTIVWLIYGVALGLLPVIIANSIISVLCMVLLFFKLTFSK
jgi:MtN3 and saliva related transmembrane protein